MTAVVESSPDLAIRGVVRWRRCHLAAWIKETFDVSLAETTVGKELRRMGYAKLSARPRYYAQDPAALAAFKNFPARLAEIRTTLADGVEIEIWWQEEVGIGQKNKIPGAGQSAALVR